MEMHEVDSSNIKKLGYDPDTMKLRVQFSSGKAYDYDDVSSEEYQSLASAESVGRHFGQNIRNAKTFNSVDPKEEGLKDG